MLAPPASRRLRHLDIVCSRHRDRRARSAATSSFYLGRARWALLPAGTARASDRARRDARSPRHVLSSFSVHVRLRLAVLTLRRMSAMRWIVFASLDRSARCCGRRLSLVRFPACRRCRGSAQGSEMRRVRGVGGVRHCRHRSHAGPPAAIVSSRVRGDHREKYRDVH